jgi:DNA-binding CsgD family transcriptional regulator
VLSTGVYSALQRPAEAGLLSMAASLALYDEHTAAARTLAEQALALGAGPSWYPLTTPTNPLAHLEGADLPADQARRLAADRMWTEFEGLRQRGLFAAASVVGARSVAEEPDPDRLAALREVTTAIPAALARHVETYADALASADPAETLTAAGRLADAGLVILAIGAYSRSLRALRAAGDAAVAARALEQAHRRLEPYGADAVAALDAQTAPGLTGRELEVARLAAAGEGNQAIADRLAISVRTVENHLHSVFRKTGLANRTDLARLRTL